MTRPSCGPDDPQPMSRTTVHSRRRSPPRPRIVTGVAPVGRTPARVRERFRALLRAGATLRPAGEARRDPGVLLEPPYLARYEVRLFDATVFLTDYLYDEGLRFLVGYVALGERSGAPIRALHPRIFYKDSSLIWRVASHFVHDADEYWIGKGDVRVEDRDGVEFLVSSEETTNLPLELQFALDGVSRRRRRRRDDDAIGLIVREAPSGRIRPYADFSAPRLAAAARHAIHGGRPIARFRRPGDPSTLVFAPGFEPDFTRGLLEANATRSEFFGGALRKFRILSANRTIQYLFFASPTHAWLTHPQALSTELSTYGVRTVDVIAPDDLSIPGYEYHEDGHSQIPAGYAGPAHPWAPNRADASPWLEELPVIREFRGKLLCKRGRR